MNDNKIFYLDRLGFCMDRAANFLIYLYGSRNKEDGEKGLYTFQYMNHNPADTNPNNGRWNYTFSFDEGVWTDAKEPGKDVELPESLEHFRKVFQLWNDIGGSFHMFIDDDFTPYDELEDEMRDDLIQQLQEQHDFNDKLMPLSKIIPSKDYK